jgi:hypothetical protein
MPNPVIPSIGNIQGRWLRRAGSAEGEFLEGVRTTTADQAAAAAAAAPVYAAAVQEAVTRGSYAKGVQKAGTARWRDKTLAKGAGRYSQGIAEGSVDYAAGFAPFAEAISRVDLPARGPRNSPQNYNRIKPIGDALNRLRTGAPR